MHIYHDHADQYSHRSARTYQIHLQLSHMLDASFLLSCTLWGYVRFFVDWLRRLSIKDLSNFFQTVAFGLREEEPRYKDNDNQKTTEQDVVMPSDVVESDRVHEGQYHERTIDRQHFHGKTFRTQ